MLTLRACRHIKKHRDLKVLWDMAAIKNLKQLGLSRYTPTCVPMVMLRETVGFLISCRHTVLRYFSLWEEEVVMRFSSSR